MSLTRTASSDETVVSLEALVRAGDVLVLTGAGISTGSGIPDYRGPDGRQRADRPMTIDRFLSGADEQRAYWARSHVGWERFRLARPNVAHEAVTALQRAGLLTGVVTQNVDGLHTAAGTADVHDLHGRLDEVVCLDCRTVTSRDELAQRLETANPGFRARVSADTSVTRPDGDILLGPDDVAGFEVVACRDCGGRLKPHVVMFGEQIPRDRYGAARELVARARSLVVLGSSLAVGSGYRFLLDAHRRGLPVAVVTRGWCRGADLATVRVDADLGAVLPALAARLAPDAPRAGGDGASTASLRT